jgi:hypothetical protein
MAVVREEYGGGRGGGVRLQFENLKIGQILN